MRNYRVGHDFVPISSNAGYNFYIGNNPEYDYTVGLRPGFPSIKLITQPIRIGIKSASTRSQYFFSKSLLFIWNEPLSYLKLLCKKTLLFLNGNEISRNRDTYSFRRFSAILSLLLWKKIVAFPFGLLCPLSLMGIVVSFKERKKFSLLYLLSSAHFIGTVMFFICSSYRIPLTPILIIFASYFIYIVYRKLLGKKYKNLFFYLLILLLLTTICNYKVGTMNSEDFVDSYCELASRLIKKRQMEEAIKYLKRALTLDPNWSEAHTNLGLIYSRKGRLDEAISEYKKALTIKPNLVEANINLGNAYGSKNMFDEAISEYKKALAINPRYAKVHYNLGNAYRKKRRIDDAISEYEKALAINPNLAGAHNNLAITYYSKGNYKLAISNCDKAIELGYSVNPKFLELIKPYR